MTNLVVAVFLCVIGVTTLTNGNESQKSQNGEIAPYLSWIAFVEGKAFYVDTKIPRNQTEASAYCSFLGMQLAEIKSEIQFEVLEQANVEEWPETWAVWTAGTEIRGIHRYAWNNSGTNIYETLPYEAIRYEESRYGLIFRRITNSSFLFNDAIAVRQGTLCETLN